MCTVPGKVYNALFDLASDQYGYVTADEAMRMGIGKDRLPAIAARGVVDRIDRGLYRFPAVPATTFDQYTEAILWPHRPRGVISHASALALRDLCDVNPAHIDITVPRTYRVTRASPSTYRLHHRDLLSVDVGWCEGVPVVTPLRAILDGIEAHLGHGLIRRAIETANKRGMIDRKTARQLKRDLDAS